MSFKNPVIGYPIFLLGGFDTSLERVAIELKILGELLDGKFRLGDSPISCFGYFTLIFLGIFFRHFSGLLS